MRFLLAKPGCVLAPPIHACHWDAPQLPHHFSKAWPLGWFSRPAALHECDVSIQTAKLRVGGAGGWGSGRQSVSEVRQGAGAATGGRPYLFHTGCTQACEQAASRALADITCIQSSINLLPCTPGQCQARAAPLEGAARAACRQSLRQPAAGKCARAEPSLDCCSSHSGHSSKTGTGGTGGTAARAEG